MSYLGESFDFPCGLAGFDSQPDVTRLSAGSLRTAEHLTFEDRSGQKRGGVAAFNATPASGSPRIVGFFDFWRQGASQLLPVATGDGKLYAAGGGAISTVLTSGLGANRLTHFMQTFDNINGRKDKCFSYDGVDAVQVWDGIAGTTSALATPPADWIGANQPKFGLIHEGRHWAFGAPNFPSFLYYGPRYNPEVFTGAGSGFFEVYGLEVTGAGELLRRLFAFTTERIFWVDDTDLNVINWRLWPLDAGGGTRSYLALVNIPGDLVFLSTDGDIVSLVGVKEFGDFRQASLAAPWLRTWLTDHLVTAQLPEARSCYDQLKRVMYFSMAIDGSPTNNVVLKGYLPPIGVVSAPIAWEVDPGIAACSLGLRRVSGVLRPFFGDYAGKLHALDQATRNDNGVAYTGKMASGSHDFGIPKRKKLYRSVEIIQQAEGNFSGLFEWFVDGKWRGQAAFSLGGDLGGVLDEFVLDVDVLGGPSVIQPEIRVSGSGERFGWQISQGGVNQSFNVSRVRANYQLT